MNKTGWPNDIWTPVRGWLLACSLFLASGAASSLDLDVLCDFEIGPQKLSSALVEFSRQANTPVVSDTTEVDHFNSAGISGRMTLKDALRALLAGTRLDYRVTDKGVIAVGGFVHGRPRQTLEMIESTCTGNSCSMRMALERISCGT